MDSLKIKGGRPLKGEVEISGAKNAALPIMTAALLTGGTHTLCRIPNLRDIATMGKLLAHMGARISVRKWGGNA